MRNNPVIEKNHIKGSRITPGNKYIPSSWIPKKILSITQIRRRLSKIRGSLAETIAVIRERG